MASLGGGLSLTINLLKDRHGQPTVPSSVLPNSPQHTAVTICLCVRLPDKPPSSMNAEALSYCL